LLFVETQNGFVALQSLSGKKQSIQFTFGHVIPVRFRARIVQELILHGATLVRLLWPLDKLLLPSLGSPLALLFLLALVWVVARVVLGGRVGVAPLLVFLVSSGSGSGSGIRQAGAPGVGVSTGMAQELARHVVSLLADSFRKLVDVLVSAFLPVSSSSSGASSSRV
jgi:hypothetical protein